MTIEELSKEYEMQFQALNNKIDALKPLLMVYKGDDLRVLRSRIKTYYNLACECKRTSKLLLEHCDSARIIETEVFEE